MRGGSGEPIQKTIIIEPTPVIIELPPAPPTSWYNTTWVQISVGAILGPLLVAYLTRRLWRTPPK